MTSLIDIFIVIHQGGATQMEFLDKYKDF